MAIATKEARATGLFISDHLQSILSAGIDLLFPPTCQHCARVDTRFCQTCLHELKNTPLDVSIHQIDSRLTVAATGIHSGILQSAVISLKYARAFEVAPLLGNRIVSALSRLDWTIDMVVPVPLHTSRLRERGYNQAKEISQRVVEQSNLHHQPDALERIRNTRSQVDLDKTQRLQNMEDAFIAQAHMVSGKTLLLIDDVFTTGATLTASADAALAVGANAVFAITITSAQV
jgi:ComF family protein